MITCIYLHFVLLLCSSPVYKKYMKLYVKKFCSVLSCTRLYFCFQGSFATNAMVLCCVCSRKTLTWMFHDWFDLTHFFIAFTGAKRHAITWINVSPLSLFSLCRLSFLLSMHTFCRLPARTNPLLCSPICSERSSSVCRELKQKAKHSFRRHLFFVPLPSECSVSLSDLFLNVLAGGFNHI